LLITGTNIPPVLASIHTLPSTGPHADAATQVLQLVDVGQGKTISVNLTNKGALIQRSTNTPPIPFSLTISRAANAGAAFAVFYNFSATVPTTGCGGGDQLCALAGTDFVPIPGRVYRTDRRPEPGKHDANQPFRGRAD